MKFSHYLLLFIIGSGIVLMVSLFQDSPGYMDADYYYAGGVRLAQGFGFSEPFLWNYLDDPEGLPHPSHSYWMPFPSILVMMGISLTGLESFTAGRLGFLLVAGLVPVVTCALAYSLSGKHNHALLAGVLAAIPGFYTSYLGTTDSFGIYMVFGGVFLIVVGDKKRVGGNLQALLLGILSGLMHLTRADGILWLFLALLSVNILAYQNDHLRRQRGFSPILRWHLLPSLVCLLGYLLIFGPWMIRNLHEFGAIIASSGTKSLWLTEYNELYSYPSSILSPSRWIGSGLDAIFRVRVYALWQNVQTALIVQGEIFLAPLVVLGLWHYRRDLRVRIGGLGWLMTLLAMTLVFPFVGWRGGFFHSGSAYQPLFWSVVPVGLELFIGWGARRRGWIPKQAWFVFSSGLICLSIILAGLTVRNRVIGPILNSPTWGESQRSYAQLEQVLHQAGAKSTDIVLVNNAPGYYVASGRSAIAIPDGDLNTTLLVAKRYGSTYLILESNHPAGLEELYKNPMGHDGIEFVTTSDDAQIYRIVE